MKTGWLPTSLAFSALTVVGVLLAVGTGVTPAPWDFSRLSFTSSNSLLGTLSLVMAAISLPIAVCSFLLWVMAKLPEITKPFIGKK